MLQKIGMFSFDTKENGGKIDENIIKMFMDAGYKVSKVTGAKYIIFKDEESENTNDDTPDDTSINTNANDNSGS